MNWFWHKIIKQFVKSLNDYIMTFKLFVLDNDTWNHNSIQIIYIKDSYLCASIYQIDITWNPITACKQPYRRKNENTSKDNLTGHLVDLYGERERERVYVCVCLPTYLCVSANLIVWGCSLIISHIYFIA